MDTFCYERQSAGSMEVGSYAHRPIFHHPDDIPSNEESALSPTELPFTADDFDDQMEQAIDLMEMLGDAEIKYAINGLLSLTPDAMPVLGETVEVRNLWSAAAVWIKEGPGIAQLVAEWMTFGYPKLCDPHSSDIARFSAHERTEHHIYARCAEHFNKTYGIVHPREQWASQRGMRRSPFVAREEALGAVFFDARGWERPQWYESNADLLDRYPGRCEPRPHEWDARWWSPITNAEHLHLREHVGMVDLTAFNEFDVEGPGALDFLQRLAVNNVDVPVGRSVYTPLLTPDGGFRADLTMMRLGEERFRVVTGAFDGGRDQYWFRRHLPADGSVTFTDRTSALCTIGVWGPEAEATMAGDRHRASRSRCDVSQAGFPYGAVREVLIDGVPCTMFRISYVGENGWEVYTAHRQRAARVGRHLGRRPGPRHPPDRHRRVRRHRSHREGLPADGRRAGERVRPGRGRAGPPQGQGGRLHRQGGLPRGPRAPAGGDAVHAGDARPHVGRRHGRATRPAATSRSSPSTASASSTPTGVCRG